MRLVGKERRSQAKQGYITIEPLHTQESPLGLLCGHLSVCLSRRTGSQLENKRHRKTYIVVNISFPRVEVAVC